MATVNGLRILCAVLTLVGLCWILTWLVRPRQRSRHCEQSPLSSSRMMENRGPRRPVSLLSASRTRRATQPSSGGTDVNNRVLIRPLTHFTSDNAYDRQPTTHDSADDRDVDAANVVSDAMNSSSIRSNTQQSAVSSMSHHHAPDLVSFCQANAYRKTIVSSTALVMDDAGAQKAREHAQAHELELNANDCHAVLSYMAQQGVPVTGSTTTAATTSSKSKILHDSVTAIFNSISPTWNVGITKSNHVRRWLSSGKAQHKSTQAYHHRSKTSMDDIAKQVLRKSKQSSFANRRQQQQQRSRSAPFHDRSSATTGDTNAAFAAHATIRVPCHVVRIRECPGAHRHIISKQDVLRLWSNTTSTPTTFEDVKAHSKASTLAAQQATPDVLRLFSRLPYTQNPATGDSDIHLIMIDTGCNMSLAGTELNIDTSTSCSTVPWETDVDDHNGHGTHTTGLAAAICNRVGLVGSGSRVTVHVIKALDKDGYGDDTTIANAISTVIKWLSTPLWKSRRVVVNMSLGAESTDGSPLPWTAMDVMVTKLVRMGAAVVVAAGNSGYPASADSPAHAPNVVTVGAFDVSTNQFASFSNTGPFVDILAPGVNVLSLYLGTDMALMDGTSMACPLAAGCIVYVAHRHPNWTMAECVNYILQASRLSRPTLSNPAVQNTPARTINRSIFVSV